MAGAAPPCPWAPFAEDRAHALRMEVRRTSLCMVGRSWAAGVQQLGLGVARGSEIACQRTETSTNSPVGSTVIRPHVFLFVGGGEVRVEASDTKRSTCGIQWIPVGSSGVRFR